MQAQVSPNRLAQIEQWASKSAFSKPGGPFPIGLFHRVVVSEANLEPFSLTIKGMQKGDD